MEFHLLVGIFFAIAFLILFALGAFAFGMAVQKSVDNERNDSHDQEGNGNKKT